MYPFHSFSYFYVASIETTRGKKHRLKDDLCGGKEDKGCLPRLALTEGLGSSNSQLYEARVYTPH
ncbi:hypothetical protein E2C01_063105 [Portunus trituberculatus]|uniref:Uncharacterized protein n=1 Tax=Portunus trituberculatus TaxID=210409 RepID=A0A5B7HJX3_PORTR|nr:hypothetical protein [Portunus trituberculatus]